MSKTKTISWMAKLDGFRGEIGATVALDARGWSEAGAKFETIEDGDGETVGVARGQAGGGSGEVDFGVLDYGEPETFLLVAADLAEVPRLTGEVLRALREAGILGAGQVLGEEGPPEPEDMGAPTEPRRIESQASVAPEADPRPWGRRKAIRLKAYAKKGLKSGTARVISFDKKSGFAVVRPYRSPKAVAVHRRDITIPRGKVPKAGEVVSIKVGTKSKARFGRSGKVRL